MDTAILKYFSFNGEIKPINDFSIPDEGKKLYEVVRIIEGVPLFMEMHFGRLKNSIKLAGLKSRFDLEKIIESFREVISLNDNKEGNIKLVLNFLEDAEDCYIYYIPHSYPKRDLYIEGINTILFNGERSNPNAKIINSELRKTVNCLLDKANAYEALLVDNQGRITEGSRSNLFFVKDNSLVTPPLEQVLPGVTRAHILKLSVENNINVYERYVNVSELREYQGAFISGTSPKVLPIKAIDSIKISSSENYLVKKVMELYDNNIDKYIKEHKQ